MASQIPGYQVVRKIGDGGMSTVYLAIQFSVGREVALKVLSPELRDDPDFAERFYREANIVGGLSHPNVIAIYDIGQHQQNYFMAMDYLPGASCSDLIKDKPLTAGKSLQIIKDIAFALSYIHKKGLLHCDIKPDNILFRADGAAVLTDFGISREIDQKVNSSLVSGTPHYMSPEQAQAKKLEPGSDIYSLGVLLYELLSGELPYTGPDAISVAIKHVSAPVPLLPSELKPLQPLINKMMNKRPSSRFKSADELLEAIDYIGASFMGREAVELPFQLKISLLLDRIKMQWQNVGEINQHLQFSIKHGLLYKNLAGDVELPDLEVLEQTMGSHTVNDLNATINSDNASVSTHTASLKSDVVALALEAQQAQIIVPRWQILSLIMIIVGIAAFPIISDSLFGFLNQFSSPTIKMVD